MKKVLGLDLGVGSIGWSIIEVDENNNEAVKILGIGSRIIPLTIDESTGFTKGNGESVCSQRTAKRQIRRGLDRYQQRRYSLGILLKELGFTFDKELLNLDPLGLWSLRADAAEGRKLSPQEIGRVIYHINQRRGYKPAKGDANSNSTSEYLAKIRERAGAALESDLTPGQYFAKLLKESESESENGRKSFNFRIKEKVFPRASYEEELGKILEKQSAFYPEVLTPEAISRIVDTVFYQRPLKSCKHLVSLCEFESREYTTENGTKIISGPRVAAASSPLAQVCRLWEAVNNIGLKNYRNKRRKKRDQSGVIPGLEATRKECFEFPISLEERRQIFDFLDNNEKLSTKDLFKILDLKKEDGFAADKAVAKGIKGNVTKFELGRALANIPNADEYLRFNVEFEDTDMVDEVTGEIVRRVSTSYLREPLYRLWHTVYSIDDYDTLAKVLADKFSITDKETVDNLFNLDFRGKGYANKSSKFICKILPYLMDGYKYSEACDAVDVNHSGSMTKEENEARELLDSLPLLNKGELRQPVVEKILNQLIHQVNEVTRVYGRPDEIRIELARTLRQSKDERSAESKRNDARARENKDIADKISSEWGLRPSVNKIQKYRMWLESGHCCMYCGKPVGVKEFLVGIDAEKEHVIPRSIFFDDSFSNKVCSCRDCNKQKGQKTGYDFMKDQGDDALNSYIERVEHLFAEYKQSKGKSGISKTKHDRLLTSRNEIPTDFIDRDLRQSQYIARKAMELLKQICRNVYATSGSVTDFFRHVWGYDNILHDLNLEAYSKADQTEMVEFEHKGEIHQEERIIGWTKRIDHRHHAIDALTIALVRQGYIQRLNNLNTLRDNAFADAASQGEEYQENLVNLEKWAAARPHFSYETAKAAVSDIAVSFKAGKKLTTPGKRVVYKNKRRIVAQTGILVPRGALTEESVYGTIKTLERRVPVKNLFARPDSIVNPDIRDAVNARLSEFGFDLKKAQSSIKKNPLRVAGIATDITYADCWNLEFVIRYKIEDIKYKNIDDIVDKGIREIVRSRFAEVGNDDKKFKSSLADSPLYSDSQQRHKIASVRCFTGLKPESMTAISHDENGKAIGYAKYGNNHHIALYFNEKGEIEERVVPMFHAVQRKKLGIPAIIKDPEEAWDMVEDLNLDKDEDQNFLSRFPMPGWKFYQSMQINEMFLIGLTDEEISYYMERGMKDKLLKHLYKVQALTSGIYEFRFHNHAVNDKSKVQIEIGNYVRISSFGTYKKQNPVKVKVDRLGNIILA